MCHRFPAWILALMASGWVAFGNVCLVLNIVGGAHDPIAVVVYFFSTWGALYHCWEWAKDTNNRIYELEALAENMTSAMARSSEQA
jgi:hypothetical protein